MSCASRDSAFSINRNIVECKYEQTAFLIRFCERINRNIVECKSNGTDNANGDNCVLIETLWNVNYSRATLDYGDYTVLIETLWNVNRCVLMSERAKPSINRNIVECKL